MPVQESKTPPQYGCFFIIPLKYDADSLDPARLEEIGDYRPLTTMDLNENIKAMFDRSNEAAVGSRYAVGCSRLVEGLCGGAASGDSQPSGSRREGTALFLCPDRLLSVCVPHPGGLSLPEPLLCADGGAQRPVQPGFGL